MFIRWKWSQLEFHQRCIIKLNKQIQIENVRRVAKRSWKSSASRCRARWRLACPCWGCRSRGGSGWTTSCRHGRARRCATGVVARCGARYGWRSAITAGDATVTYAADGPEHDGSANADDWSRAATTDGPAVRHAVAAWDAIAITTIADVWSGEPTEALFRLNWNWRIRHAQQVPGRGAHARQPGKLQAYSLARLTFIFPNIDQARQRRGWEAEEAQALLRWLPQQQDRLHLPSCFHADRSETQGSLRKEWAHGPDLRVQD